MTDDPERVPEPTVEVYPGAPLKAVAIECAFTPQLDALQRFGAFQRRHAHSFPRVSLGDPSDPRDSSMLLDEGKTRGVAISTALLSVVTYSYAGGFASFEEWAKPILRDGLDVLEVTRFTGVTYRYENLIELNVGPRAMALDEVVRVSLPSHPSAKLPVRDLMIGWTQPWSSGEVVVDIGSFTEPSAHMHVDIAARRAGPLQRDDLTDAIREAHRMARLTFEELITPSFREHLRRARS